MAAIGDLLQIMRRLRDAEHGCPWVAKQDFASIAPYTVEEAYEVADAIEREAWDELRGELGDILLHVAWHAQMAEERGLFGFGDVATEVCRKMIERHPHVFGEAGVRTEEEIEAQWERLKHREREAAGSKGVLAGVPPAQPALARARKLQQRAARVGFDWQEARQVEAKIEEELDELRAARNAAERAAEIGDLLFTVANYARHCDLRPEELLHQACARFTRRFEHMEERMRQCGETAEEISASRWDELWNEAKRAAP